MTWVGSTLYIVGHDNSTGYGIYTASGTGSFSAVTSTPRYASPPSCITYDFSGNLFVSFVVLNDTSISVPFGGAGYTTYALASTIAQIDTTEETSGGNPSDHLQVDVNASYSSPSRQAGYITIQSLPSGAFIKKVTLDAYWDTVGGQRDIQLQNLTGCLLYTSPSPRDGLLSRMPSSA